MGCCPVGETGDLRGYAFPVRADLQHRPLTLRRPAPEDHRHAAFWEDAVEFQAPTFPEDEQPTRQLIHPGLDTIPEAPHKTLTGLVEAGTSG